MVQTAQELADTEEHVHFVSSCQDDKMDIVKHRAQIRMTGKTKKKQKTKDEAATLTFWSYCWTRAKLLFSQHKRACSTGTNMSFGGLLGGCSSGGRPAIY